MHESEPSTKYTLSDLPALTVLEAASREQAYMEVLIGDLDEETLAERVPGKLISVPTTTEAPEMRAMCVLAGRGDPDTLRHLAFNAQYSSVLKKVASNPMTPLDALEHLTTVHHYGIAMAAAANASYPVWLLPQLYEGGERDVRLGIMAHPETPEQLIDRAAADPDHYIRCQAASHRHVGIDTLTRLSSDPSDAVRAYVASNPATPAHLVDRLATDSSSSVLQGLLNRPEVPAEMFDSIVERALRGAGDGMWWVLSQAAGSAHLTSAAAPLLSDVGLAHKIARNPRTPAGELRDLARWGTSTVREEVARNESCPLDLRLRLTRDKSSDVREAAASGLPKELDPRKFATLPDLTPGTVVEVRGLSCADRYQLLIREVGDIGIVPNPLTGEGDLTLVTLTGVRRRVNGAPSRRYPGETTVEVFLGGLRLVSEPSP